MTHYGNRLKISPAWRRIGIAALLGLLFGTGIAQLHMNYRLALAEQHLTVSALIQETDATLSEWRADYISRTLPEAIASLALSPERSHRLVQGREKLIQSFEQILPVQDEPELLLSSRQHILIRSPGGAR